MPVPLPAEGDSLLEQVKKDMKLSEKECKIISAFTVFGFDITHIGTTWFKYGAAVGDYQLSL